MEDSDQLASKTRYAGGASDAVRGATALVGTLQMLRAINHGHSNVQMRGGTDIIDHQIGGWRSAKNETTMSNPNNIRQTLTTTWFSTRVPSSP